MVGRDRDADRGVTPTLVDPGAETYADARTGASERPPSIPPSLKVPSASPILPAPGERFGENGRFEIIERLGAGGMGHVFRAVDWHLDRTVAIKFIQQNREMPLQQLVALLRREAKATAKLNHENIVSIFDMEAYGGVPFLVMEMLAGQSLETMLERSRLSPRRATQIMVQVARGLMHAHSKGVIHRDLKPSNVLVLRDGRAKILDFGISSFERPAFAQVPSEAGSVTTSLGTPAFMAPEQWRSGPQDARTDIWAAGVMFYQLLTGRLPYAIPELVKFRIATRVRSVAPSVRLLAPALPDEAERIVATALSEEPEGRFQSAQQLWEALRDLERVLRGAAVIADGLSPLPQVERRPLTLMWCALSGTEGLDLDDLIAADRYFHLACAEAVKRWDGCIGTPIGGGVFCCFGYPTVQETDAPHAVRAALQIANTMREIAREDGPSIDFQIGIHSGVVGLPNVTGSAQGLPAIQGDVPNVARRLAEGAAPNGIVISQATLDRTAGSFLTERLGSGSDRGYRIVRAIESESRFEQAFAAQLTPLVGRDAELETLHRLWDEAKNGCGQIVMVRGEPGIGKSRLVQTLKDRVIEEGNVRLTCQCWPHFRNSALHPVNELLLRSMDIDREDPPEQKLEKLSQSLASLGFELAEMVPLFASLLSISFEDRYEPLALTPEQHKVKTLEALASALLRMAADGPALFIVEDMQWVDPSTVEFLNELVDLVPSARLLVVLTCRPEFRTPWSARAHLHTLSIDRLSWAFTASMIEQASHDRRLPPAMISRLVATTDGVPLFIEESTRMVIESWRPDDPEQMAPMMAIPATLHELLLARLGRMRGIDKEIAQLGAVLGRDFSYALLRHMSPLDEMSLQRSLEALVDAGILLHQGKPPDSTYVFKHALIQQAAYQSLVKTERQRLHGRAAGVLQEHFSETVETEAELLAHHHAEAGHVTEALGFWEKAGHRATQRSELVEAMEHYGRALHASRGLPEGPARDAKELEVLLALGSARMSVHGPASPEVEKTYARARELAYAVDEKTDLFRAMHGLWQFHFVGGMLPSARELGRELLEIARVAGNSTFLLMAHRAVGSTSYLQGDFEMGLEHTQAGFALYDIRQHGSLALHAGHDPGVAHCVYMAANLWTLGYADQASARTAQALDLAKRLNHPMSIVYALCFAAMVHNYRGEHVEAKALADEARALTTENKFALWTAWARIQRGWALASCEAYVSGIAQMKEGLEGWMKTGARAGVSSFPVILAEACLRAGLLTDAASLLDDATRIMDSNDEHVCEPDLYRLKGELALRLGGKGAESEAAAHFRRGLEIARAQKAKAWELRLAMSRARLLSARGETEQAHDELRTVYESFTEGYETADLREARAQLEAMGGPP